jgi:glycosyltransferase involved in cell wall biosynthesis
MSQPRQRPRVLYVVSEDWYFHSHRLPLAQAAIREGFDVAVATGAGEHSDAIIRAGIRLHPLGMQRRSMQPLREIATLLRLRRIVAAERPDIVHNVALKPVLYGSIAARLAGRPKVVNAIAGMGYLFTSSALRARLLKPVVKFCLGVLLDNGRSRTIVQNPEDSLFLTRSGMARADRISLIRGSGVDARAFAPLAEPPGVPVVMLASRMLRDKGVPEFAEAARILHDEGIAARFVLVGAPDPHNPASVPESELRSLHARYGVEWWGPRSDMPSVLAAASIVCLPTTYGEGLPKILLEAASCGRAIVATDVQGCREIVKNEVNGLLVAPSDTRALAAAIGRLLREPGLRSRMGAQGRALVEEHFTIESVTRATLSLYRELLEDRAA